MKRCVLIPAFLGACVLNACSGGSGAPPPVLPATQLSVTSPVGSATAGTPFNVTVTALGATGTVATTYAGSVHFTSTDPQALLPGDSSLTGGTKTFSVTFKTAGNQIVTVSDTTNASITGNLGGVTINPASPTKFVVSGPAAATILMPININVAVQDAYGNAIGGYGGTVKFTSSDPQAVLPATGGLPAGGSVSVTLKTPGNQSITATDAAAASLTGTCSGINVVTNAATHFGFSGPASALARGSFTFTISALDGANNVSTGYGGTVQLTSSDTAAKLPSTAALSLGVSQSISATLETVGSGSQTITATDSTTKSLAGMETISVSAPSDLNISSAVPPAGTVGTLYDPHVIRICVVVLFLRCGQFTNVMVHGSPLTGTGGIPPYSWSWAAAQNSSLPPGLNVVNAGNIDCGAARAPRPACIFGTPTQPNSYSVVVTATDSGLPSVQTSATYTMVINPPPPPVVDTVSPAPAVLGQPYLFTFIAGGYPPMTWSESGPLPPGLTFDSNTAVLSGTPTQTGSFPITLTATDQFKQSSQGVSFTIVVTQHGFLMTGSMAVARRFHTATLLNNGKVLIAGGEDAGSTAFNSAELYDPATGTFSATGNMNVARVGHTATLLGSGKVLITGGASNGSESAVDTAELYDPATGTFTLTTGSMTAARVTHAATLLNDGRVLITGGDGIFFNGIGNTSIASLASAETFDPATGKFTATGNMTAARESHTATLLGSGKVLIAGGSDGALGNASPTPTVYATAEVFDPAAGQFTAVGMMSAARDFFTANLLGSGKVLMTGGTNTTGAIVAAADLFDPTALNFTAAGNLVLPRFYHDATNLSDGTILVSGGSDGSKTLASAEVFDPAKGTFASTGSMNLAREWHTATLLPSGKVLITGGTGTATAEIYQ